MELWNALYSLRQKSSTRTSRSTSTNGQPVSQQPLARRPEPAQVFGKVQIRNAKELIWEIASVGQYGTVRGKAENNPNT
jgi:hypothetical protein